jgi:S-phase kinase-associated protein 1
MSVQLFTSDGSIFFVDEDVAKQSETISNILEDMGSEDPIPIPNVETETLELIIRFCKFYSNHHTDEEEKEFDSVFFDIEINTIISALTAANFLNIPRLIEKASMAVANLIRGRSPAELRTLLGIKKEYTKEEMDSVMHENRWAFSPRVSYRQN